MKRLLVLFLFLLFSVEARAESGTLYIKLDSTKLRSAPQNFAPSVAKLSLGNSVTVIDEKDGWYRVKSSKGSGYLHESSLSSTKVVLNSKSAKADSSDVVLAGKGFNSQVEKEYAARNPNISFANVNALVAIEVSDSEIVAFAKSGGLKING